VPMMMKAQMTPTWDDLDNRKSRWVNIIGRLKPGVTPEQAEVQLNVVYRQANELEVEALTGATEAMRKRFVEKHLEVLPGGRGLSDLRSQFSVALIVLMAMVGVVLLIACTNIANLLMARATSRQKEFAIRLALGAGRSRIVRQQLVESMLLALGGSLVGLFLANVTGTLLLSALPGAGPAQTLSASADLRVVTFTLLLALATALVFGIVPALHATRPAVTSALKEEAGAVAGGGRQAKVRRGLVVCQVALSMLLLAGAGLFARSLYNLRSIDPGFKTERLIAFSVDPSLSGYDQNRALSLYERLQQELSAIPGVRNVSMSELGALTGSAWGMTIRVDGYQQKENEDMTPSFDGVGPGYFTTMGIPLVRGREFTERDTKDAPRVAVINETMAKYFFGDTDPLGRRFGLGRDAQAKIEIVGVVKDVRSLTLRDKAVRFAYLPYQQDESLTQLTFYVRTAGAEASASDAIREAVRRFDPNLPVYDMKSMEAQVAESLFVERMVAALSVAFGVLATALAAIGLYGVMSYAVARRTREIGIRMALGAEPGGVLWLVLKEVALLATVGVAAGLIVAFFAARRVESQLFGLSPSDPATLAGAVALLFTVALLAGFIPARRATRIDPLVALRAE
jgi:putative ABC transport system permease protein